MPTELPDWLKKDHRESRPPAQTERPIGIGILVVLHLIGGLVMAVVMAPMIGNLEKMRDPLAAVGIPPVLFLVGLGFLGLLGALSGIGMWLGKKWGWWLGAFYYVYGVARDLLALLMIAELADGLAAGSRGVGYYYVKHTARALIHALILLYFFKVSVLAYFGLEHISKWKALGKLVAVCAAITVFVEIVTALEGD